MSGLRDTRTGAGPARSWPARGRMARILPLVVLAAACGYHLSGRNQFLPPSIHTIAIPLFANDTRQVEVGQRITQALLLEFAKRGKYRTQPERQGADAVLEGTVTGFATTPVTLNQQGGATRVEVVIQARVGLTDVAAGKLIWSQDHFIFRSQYDIDPTARNSFDRQMVAIDRVARDFADTVVSSLLEGY
jgi:hypothetical protein